MVQITICKGEDGCIAVEQLLIGPGRMPWWFGQKLTELFGQPLGGVQDLIAFVVQGVDNGP